MVKGVDELIYFLLERISLCSGATYVEIERYVREFYSQPDEPHSQSCENQFESDGAEVRQPTPRPANVDARLLDKVWQWLTKHPDIRVGNKSKLRPSSDLPQPISQNAPSAKSAEHAASEGNEFHDPTNNHEGSFDTRQSSSAAAVRNDVRLAEVNHRGLDGKNSNIDARDSGNQSINSESQYDDLVLLPSTERKWQAITGHDVDFGRVHKMEFELLSIIAAAGEQGIVQPVLIQQSGQDKRSVPKRTDELQRKGYIMKTAFRMPGENTSHCVLRKLAKSTSKSQVSRPWLEMPPDQIKDAIFHRGVDNKSEFFDASITIIKQAGIITTDDFRARIGIKAQRPLRSAAELWLQQMELVGCIQRVLASRSDSRAKQKAPNVKCLKFVKDVEKSARDAYLKFQSKDRQFLWKESRNESDQAEENFSTTGNNDTASKPGAETPGHPALAFNWHPQRPWESQIYEIVHQTGSRGISLSELVNALAGAASYRSLDSVLSSMSDAWQKSQPPHLLHLAIIRDTVLRNGNSNYVYRTYPNFDLAVKAGDASWEAVGVPYPDTEKAPSHCGTSDQDLDEWGFPKISDSEFRTPRPAKISSQKRTSNLGKRHSTSVQSPPNKRRKIDTTSSLRKSTADVRSTKAPNPALSDRTSLIAKKVHFDFGAQMRKRAEHLLNETSSLVEQSVSVTKGVARGDDSKKRKRDCSPQAAHESPLQSPDQVTSVDYQSQFQQNQRKRQRNEDQPSALQEMHRNLVLMTLPGLYINPPQRLARAKGRPQKKMLLVFKSSRLMEIDWFKNSPESDRYHHDPSTTFRPLIVFENSVELPPETIEDTNRQETEVPPRTSPMLRGNDKLLRPDGSQQETRKTRNVEQANQDTRLSHHSSTAAVPAERDVDVRETTEQSATSLQSKPVPTSTDLMLSNQPSNQTTPSSPPALLRTSQQQSQSAKPSRVGVRLSGGSKQFQRTEILMRIVRQAGGVYPGPKEMWYPFVTSLKKADIASKPDAGTVERALKSLVSSGKLRKLQFGFKTKGGAYAQKSIIALPEFDRSSEAVKDLEKKIIEKHPEHYLPPKVEVDPELTLRQGPRVTAYANQASNGSEYVVAPEVTMRRAYNESPRKQRLWAQDEDDEEEACEEQRALQSQFYVRSYIHQPESAAKGGNTVGSKLSKRIRLETSSESEQPTAEASPSSDVPYNYDLRLFEDSPLESGVPSVQGHRTRKLQFIAAAETAAAAQQEYLREQQDFKDQVVGSLCPMRKGMIPVNPVSWIVSWSRIDVRYSEARARLAVTLTDPDQDFDPTSGTFSTGFGVIRDIRPKLKLQPNLQREFEDQVPKSLREIIHDHRRRRPPGPPPKKKKSPSFATVVDEVEKWERNNSQLLTSRGSLMTPRFINHTVDEDDGFQDLASFSGSQNATTVSVSQKEGSNQTKDKDEQSTTAAKASISAKAVRPSAARNGVNSSTLLVQRPVLPGIPIQPGRVPAASNLLAETQIKRLCAIVVVVRCLLGGTSRVIKWPIVSQFYPDFSRYRWNKLLQDYASYIDEFEAAFQEKFVQDYRNGDVEAPDYSNPGAYDWEATVTWALSRVRIQLKIDKPREESQPTRKGNTVDERKLSNMLLEDPQSFHKHYALRERANRFEGSTSAYLSTYLSFINRKRAVKDIPYGSPLRKTGLQPPACGALEFERGEEDVVKSYVRANILTPESTYNADLARARLVSFGEDALKAAVKALQKAKIIKQENKGRAIPGRNYSMYKNYFDNSRHIWSYKILAKAVDYTHLLDRKFAAQGYAEFSPHASQGDMIAILNLLASRRIDVRVVQPSTTSDPGKVPTLDATGNRTVSIWGFTQGDYVSRHIDMRNFVFPVRLEPTSLWAEEIPTTSAFVEPPAPHLAGRTASSNSKGERRIPLWYDIHDRLIPETWKLILAAVANVVALAPGASAKEIAVYCKKMAEQWEVQLVLEWLEQVGVVKRTTGQGHGRFTTTEWWWFVLGNYVASRPSV